VLPREPAGPHIPAAAGGMSEPSSKPPISGPALADKLRLLRNGNPSAAQLKAGLEQAQADLESLYDQGDIPPELNRSPQCGYPGCNYRRWPIAGHCLFHSVGKDSLAARLRLVSQAERASAKQRCIPL
jgi:hypothetical protein